MSDLKLSHCIWHNFISLFQTAPAVEMRPRVDGKFLPEFPEALLKKRKPYNLIIGVVHDEMGSMSRRNCCYSIEINTWPITFVRLLLYRQWILWMLIVRTDTNHVSYTWYFIWLETLTMCRLIQLVFSDFAELPGFSAGLVQTEDAFHRSAVYFDCRTFKFSSMVNFTANYHYSRSATPEASNLDKRHFWFQQAVAVSSCFYYCWFNAYFSLSFSSERVR